MATVSRSTYRLAPPKIRQFRFPFDDVRRTISDKFFDADFPILQSKFPSPVPQFQHSSALCNDKR